MNWLDFRRLTRAGSWSLGALLTVAGLSTGSLLLSPAEASADDTNPCPFSDVLCLFDGEDYTGAVWNVRAWPPGTSTCVGLPEHGWEGRAESAINRGTQNAYLFPNEDCSGYPVTLLPGEWLSPLEFAPKSVFVF
ncbi:peptidase inhibitor family I36 protein [Myxococcus sp. XM-1-1-1]|uniref:peptidase inhibitor family I36 protein n=1 Tax=Myxococcus sp. XM-1-1-1 TaxID=2874602 RepID=UPI001CBEF02C|nr:peptidase inhibitor family I36 protein [Myxococcus sp. XM-1-1-1]MBZ4414721.1 peptidase inhibitor family I36 protein [Myxococcus sp. XM-1-1-1]